MTLFFSNGWWSRLRTWCSAVRAWMTTYIQAFVGWPVLSYWGGAPRSLFCFCSSTPLPQYVFPRPQAAIGTTSLNSNTLRSSLCRQGICLDRYQNGLDEVSEYLTAKITVPPITGSGAAAGVQKCCSFRHEPVQDDCDRASQHSTFGLSGCSRRSIIVSGQGEPRTARWRRMEDSPVGYRAF